MKASVLIPAYNASVTLPLVLKSLNLQDFSDFEVVLMDDGSTDDTSAVAHHHTGRLDLHVHRTAQNLGSGCARNFGAGKTQGEILLLLDSDVEVFPDYISAHLALHHRQPRAVGVGSLEFPYNLARQGLARYYATRGRVKLNNPSLMPGKYFVSTVASVPRSLFDEVGGFDPAFRSYGGDDLELGLRLEKVGAHLEYLPLAKAYHHHLRTIKQMIKAVESYGRGSVPLILERHPEFAREMVLDDMIEPFSRGSLTTLARRVICAGIFFYPLRTLADLLQRGPLPFRLLDYLTWRSYRRGFARSLSDNRLKSGARRM